MLGAPGWASAWVPRPLLLLLWDVMAVLRQEPPGASLSSMQQPGLRVVVEKVLVPVRTG